MAQHDFGNPTSPLSGTALVNLITNWRDGLHSLHSGSSRPSYVTAGMLWLDTTTNPWIAKIFDGSDDIPCFQINTSTNQLLIYASAVAGLAIAPASVAATGTVTGSNLSGTNTGDQFTSATAESFLANNTGSAATPVPIALSTKQLAGRGASGHVAPITLAGELDMAGTALGLSKATAAPQAPASGTVTVDLGAGNSWEKITPSGNFTLALTGTTTKVESMIVEAVSWGAVTVTLPTMKWKGGSPPTWTVSGTDHVIFYKDSADNYYGAVIGQAFA